MAGGEASAHEIAGLGEFFAMGFHRHVAAAGFASEVADREPSDELEMLEDFPPLGLDEISKYRKKHGCGYESPMLEGDRQSVNLRISGKRTL